MTKLSTTSLEKPPAEVVNLREDDDESDDDDMKKNIYNEIPEYDDVDEVKLSVETLDIDAALRRQNAANENLYSEIQTSEERFENALYMAANVKDPEVEKQKTTAITASPGGSVFPSMSPKTRSFYPVGAPLPSIPSSMKIPEEKEPSWCCGTRRRRRRNLVLGLFLAVFFLLFLCIALLVRMYVPPKDDGFQGGWNAAALKGDSAWMFDNRLEDADEPLVLDDALFEPETAPVSPEGEEEKAFKYAEGVIPKGVAGVNRTTASTSTPEMLTSTAGFDEGISTAEFLSQEVGSDGGSWEVDNQIVPSTEEPRRKTKHSKSICTSWQGRRRLDLSCPEEDYEIYIVSSFYGWSRSETVCKESGRDTYCRISETDTRRCNGYRDCQFWADPSGWLIGCSGFHDYLQVDYYCVPT